MASFVETSVEGGVATITLNRPDRLNAIGTEMGEMLDDAFRQTGLDDGIKVIILTGAGRGFCAGADMERLDGLVESAGATFSNPRPGQPNPAYDVFEDSPPEYRSRYSAPAAIPKPVIGAINGACAGIGLALAMACDVRFGSMNAMFCAAFPRRGLTAEGGLAFTLQAAIGTGAAADMLLSGRKVHAEEAFRLGLISRLTANDDLLAEAQAYARDIADGVSPRSARVIKRQLQAARSQTFMEAMQRAHDEVVASLESEDFAEGVASFRARRPPVFKGR